MTVRSSIRRFIPPTLRPIARRLATYLDLTQDRGRRRAHRAAARGEWHTAARLWAEVIAASDLATVEPEPYAHLAWALYKKGDHERAVAVQRQVLLLDASDPRWLHRYALMSQRLRDWDGVIAAYRRALALLDGEITWKVRLGRALELSGRIDEAREVYEETLFEADPPPRPLYSRLAALHRRRGAFEVTERLLLDAAQHYPTSVKLAREHAKLAVDRKDWVAAEGRWRRVLSLAPGDPPSRDLFGLGRSLQALGRYREAQDAFDAALARLVEVDRPWVFEALAEWEFRWEYCRLRAQDGTPQHPSLQVVLEPQPDTGGEATEVGRYSVEVTHLGLLITGYVEVPQASNVSLRVDGREFRTVDLEGSPTSGETLRRRFRFAVKHPTLDRFPHVSTLDALVDGQPLRADGGGSGMTLRVPHGDGGLLRHLGDRSPITKKGTLVTDVEPNGHHGSRVLEAYYVAREVFGTHFGRGLFLLYGTLLGYVRDGDFIAGDDDLDVGYLSDARDPHELKHMALAVADRLLKLGFDVGIRVSGGLFKLYVHGRELDVYPVWFRGGRAWAYSDIAATREDFEPLTTGRFKDVEVYLPGSPETVLEGTYGPDWHIPRPSFRHYRPLEVRRVLEQTWVSPQEAHVLRARNRHDQEQREGVGTLLVGHSPDRPQIVTHRLPATGHLRSSRQPRPRQPL